MHKHAGMHTHTSKTHGRMFVHTCARMHVRMAQMSTLVQLSVSSRVHLCIRAHISVRVCTSPCACMQMHLLTCTIHTCAPARLRSHECSHMQAPRMCAAHAHSQPARHTCSTHAPHAQGQRGRMGQSTSTKSSSMTLMMPRLQMLATRTRKGDETSCQCRSRRTIRQQEADPHSHYPQRGQPTRPRSERRGRHSW